MTHTRTTQNLLSNAAERLQAVKVTILHEDLPTALYAKALFDCVVPELDGVDLELDYWRFDVLRDPELRSESARSAQSSAIIVFSVGNRKLLSPEIRDWLNRWARARGEHPCAFVALLGACRSESADEDPILRQLQRAAEKSGADFFCEYCEPSFLRSPLPESGNIAQANDGRWTPFNGSAEHKPTDCWRVNA
jgi:hypothetical protein